MEKYCRNCNLSNSSDAMFCRHCATPLGPSDYRQPQPNQGQYPQPGRPVASGIAPPAGGSPSRATIAVILAVCGILCCGPFAGIPAAILGWLEVTAIKEGKAPASGMTMAQIGLWGGVAGTILGTIGYFVIFVLSLAGGGRGY